MTSSNPHENPAPGRPDAPPGFAVWLTGLPASGKTTIARELQKRCRDAGTDAELLDSDELRSMLTPRPRYDEYERGLFYRAVACLAAHLVKHRVNVVIAATANRRRHREPARTWIDRFLEVYVDCPLATCEARDPKGLYRRARQGDTTSIPGVQTDYEPPLEPDAVIHSDTQSPQEAADEILRELRCRGWVAPPNDHP